MGKYYAVRKGRCTGIFDDWEECKKQINGFSGAVYKSFNSHEEAIEYLDKDKLLKKQHNLDLKKLHIYVDGSYSDKHNMYSYGCVILLNDEIIKNLNGVENEENRLSMRNVSGELKGAIEGINWAEKNGYKSVTIYYDYEGIERWANDEWKANKEGTINYKQFIYKKRKFMDIDFIKVKAHSGDKYNEFADKLASMAFDNIEIDNIIEADSVKLFWETMNKSYKSKAKCKIKYQLDDVIISNKKLEKFVKLHWIQVADKNTEIKSIEINMKMLIRKIEWIVIDTSNNENKFSLTI